MTTFQSIIYGILHGFTVFLPVSASAHQALIPYLLQWQAPSGAFDAALSLGAALSVLVYFRHDWASIISGFLQVIIYRKRPMTLDERLPLFMFVTGVPLAIAWFYLRTWATDFEWTPPIISGVLIAGGVLILLTDRNSRKNKGMFDWNWLDCLIVGVFGIFFLIPGGGITGGMIPGALFRNYSREAAAKYSFFAMFPILAFSAYMHFKTDVQWNVGAPAPDLSWLSFNIATLVTFLTGLLAVGGLMKHVLKKSFGHYVVYRFLLAAATLGVFWMRSRA